MHCAPGFRRKVRSTSALDWSPGISGSAAATANASTIQAGLEYLIRWRILLATDRMANTSDSISEIAQSLGYESASAFTKAFKKIMGCSRQRYRRGQNSVALASGEGEAARANPLQPLAS
jgi:AraC-like DNA-binding protein